MKYYINGYKSPIILFKNSTNALLNTLNLPMCDKDGLMEEILFETDYDRVLLNRNKDRDIAGFHMRFTLSYKSKMVVTDLLNAQEIARFSINKAKRSDKIIIIPRSEYKWRFFEVNLINDRIVLNIAKHGIRAKGMTGLELVFETVNLLGQGDLNWIDPNNVQYYGYGITQRTGTLQTS